MTKEHTMTNFSEIAAQIETKLVADSKVMDWMGRNVRCPSLIPGAVYIMKLWSVKHMTGSDNPYELVEFVGSGREDTGTRVLFAENPAIKEMNPGDYFYFKSINGEVFGAFMHENCVCVTTAAVRVTCFEVKGHEATPPSDKPARAPKTARTPKENKREALHSIDSDDGPVDECDDDDGLGSPFAVVCHPISCAPLRRQPEGFRRQA
jgi:hypothetical protein